MDVVVGKRAHVEAAPRSLPPLGHVLQVSGEPTIVREANESVRIAEVGRNICIVELALYGAVQESQVDRLNCAPGCLARRPHKLGPSAQFSPPVIVVEPSDRVVVIRLAELTHK